MLTPKDIAKMIDHSLLRPELDVEAVKKGLAVAKKYGTATVCVRPCDLGLAREALAGTEVGLCTVIGFPHGSNETAVKVFEAERAMDACEICVKAGADFVKTSTGYAPSGATLEDVCLMRASVPDRMQVKAAGGVRTLDALLAFRAAGCARCGATATEAILQEAERRFAEKGTLD